MDTQKDTRDIQTPGESHGKKQEEDSHLQAKQQGLPRNPASTLILDFQAAEQ